MGVYSTVFASLACASCGADFRTDVQFYTDDDRDMPEYEVGQVVSVLTPDSTYEGIADAFCVACMARWEADENEAKFEALAIAIEAGEIVARFATYQVARARLADGPVLTILREAPLTPKEARDLGSFGGRFGDARVVLFRDGARLAPLEPWWLVNHGRVRELLAKKGWRCPEGTRDLVVLVGSDGRIDVKATG